MGKREATSKESGAAQIFLLIVYVHLVASQRSDDQATAEAPSRSPSPPELPYSSPNTCPDHLITQILGALICTPPSVALPPPPHDGGDLKSEVKLSPARFTEAAVRALLASRRDKGTQYWEILFILVFPAAVCALFLYDIPIRNMSPTFAQEQLLVISFVNAVMAFLLPAEWLWVPAVCFASSLLTLIIAPWLP